MFHSLVEVTCTLSSMGIRRLRYARVAAASVLEIPAGDPGLSQYTVWPLGVYSVTLLPGPRGAKTPTTHVVQDRRTKLAVATSEV